MRNPFGLSMFRRFNARFRAPAPPRSLQNPLRYGMMWGRTRRDPSAVGPNRWELLLLSPETNLAQNEKGSVFAPVAMFLFLAAMFYYWYNVRYGLQALMNVAMPLCFAAFGILAYRRVYARRAEYGIALAFFLWYLLTRALNGDWFLDGAAFNAPFLCIALCVALPLSGSMPRGRRDAFELALGLLIVGFFTLVALLSIYAVLTNQTLQLPKATFTIGLDISRRLEVWMKQANIMGALFSVCILIAVFLYTRLRHRLWFLLPLLGVGAILYVALGLTLSRTSMIGLSALLSVFLATLLYRAAGRLKKPLRIALAVALLLGSAFVLYKGFGVTNEALSRVSLALYPRVEATAEAGSAQTGAEASASAGAQASAATGTEATTPADAEATLVGEARDFSDLKTLSGRTLIYAATFRAIGDRPLTLLIGNLDESVMEGVNPYLPYPFAHTHNAVLQVLMTCGLVGTGLMLWFVVRLLIGVARLCLSRAATASDLVLALIPLAVLVHSLFEPFIFTYYDVINPIFFLFAGMALSRLDDRASATPAVAHAATGR